VQGTRFRVQGSGRFWGMRPGGKDRREKIEERRKKNEELHGEGQRFRIFKF
jgi:hypothetical protein